MSEYYAVQRSGEYLEHYGVKGMKWGVRKAVEKGNSRKLTRQYIKASKKLAKLQNKANVGYQKKRIKDASNHQKAAVALGALNLGITGGMTAASVSRAIKQARKTGHGHIDAYLPVGAGIAADIIARQISKRKAKKLTTSAGHKAAVKKANDFKREMSNAFKGTKYSKNIQGMATDIAAKKRLRVERNIAAYDKAYAKSAIGRAEAYANRRKANSGTRYANGGTNRQGKKRSKRS